MMAAETTFARLVERIGFGRLVSGAVALFVIAALLLPPISILQRLGLVGYETLNADHAMVSHPDGMTLQVDSEAFEDRLRVRLESVPQMVFLEGSGGSDLKEAAKALPDHLEVRSPFYRIKARGKSSHPVWVDVLVPNDAEPWETLDLYTWDGERWAWVGSDLHTEIAGEEFVRAEATELPQSVVVMQNVSADGEVATYLDSDDLLAQVHLFNDVSPTGLLMGTMGGFAGDVNNLSMPEEDTGCAVLPALRNWAPGGSVNEGLLGDFLDDPEAQQTHIDKIVQICTERGFDGVEIDYRGVGVEQREAYTAFVGALADTLHAADLRLSVTVERPHMVDGGWTTGGYDLVALGEVADAVQVPFPADPDAYVEGGRVDRLLRWATAQVPRRKLRMLVSSLSTTVAEGTDVHECVSAEEALVPFGEVTALDEAKKVEPQSEVAFGLSGSLLSTSPLEEAATYALRYKTEEGDVSVGWLGTAGNLAHKLRWAKRYRLGGVVVADALDRGNFDGVLDVVAAYPDVETASVPSPEDMRIDWTVMEAGEEITGQSGLLSRPSYTWTAPETPGPYIVSASVAGSDHGSVVVTVTDTESSSEMASGAITETGTITGAAEMSEAPGATEPMEEGEEAEETEEGEETSEGADANCPNATFVSDVTVPDNTQMEQGEAFEKTWQVENNGSCAWPDDTILAFIGGDQMGAPESVEVPAVEPGGKKDITVQMEAPAEDGSYTGKWQLRSGDTGFGGQFWVKIVVGEADQAAPAPAPAPAPSGGGSFELGGHIRDWGFPYADKMHYAGMNWAKVQVHYPGDASGIIAGAHANGFKIQLSAKGPANMVTEPGFEQKVADWVAGLAASGADAIEVWNEPNIDREWQGGHISPQAYTNLLCTAYSAIKNANAGTAVISAAPSPTGYFGGCSANGCDDQPWLQGLVNAGAAQCMDYIGAHHNGGATSPSASTGHPGDNGAHHHSWYFMPQTRLYYNIFGGARKLFYTEMGYASQEGVPPFSDQFAWARGITNAEQAAWLKEAVQLSINSGMVRCIIVWNIDYVRYGYDPQDGFAIIRPGGSCPACDSLHSVLGTR